MESSRSLLLPEKKKLLLHKTITTLCGKDNANLAFIDQHIATFNLALNATHSQYSLENRVKPIILQINKIKDFFEEILAYAKSQRIFILEQLDSRVLATITKVNKLSKDYDRLFQVYRDKEDYRINVIRNGSVEEINALPPITPDDTKKLLSALADLEKPLKKMHKWLAEATNTLLDEELFLPIIETQIDVFKNEKIKKELNNHCSLITSDALFKLKTVGEVNAFVASFLTWQSVNNQIIDGLRATFKLHESISFVIKSLLTSNAYKKYHGVDKHGTAVKNLMTTVNYDVRDINVMLGLKRKIQERLTTLNFRNVPVAVKEREPAQQTDEQVASKSRHPKRAAYKDLRGISVAILPRFFDQPRKISDGTVTARPNSSRDDEQKAESDRSLRSGDKNPDDWNIPYY